jgi:drug/metabolite transporter superfamily protein YnfA
VSTRLIQFALLLAGTGAVAILLGVLGTAADVAGLAAIVVGTILTAPAGRREGNGWWTLLAAGTILSVCGALLALATDSVGGLIALIGGIVVVTGAAFGFPSRS